VQAVDMKKIDRPVCKMGQRFVEGRTHEPREGAVMAVMKGAEVAINILGIKSRVFVALPGVDRKTRRRKTQRLHSLAHG